MPTNLNLQFGDRIAVLGPSGATVDTQGIFISQSGMQLVWVAVGTTGPFAGLPTLFVTDLTGSTVQKIV